MSQNQLILDLDASKISIFFQISFEPKSGRPFEHDSKLDFDELQASKARNFFS